MAEGVFSTDELKGVTGYDRRRDLENCLTKAGIRWFPGKDGPWTTINLINAAGGLLVANDTADSYPVDMKPVISP